MMALPKNIKQTICTAFLVAVSLTIPANLDASVVRFNSKLGSFDVDLYENQTPLTVANFLVYLNSGAYTNSIIHRSVPGFIIQGGGFYIDGTAVSTAASVVNEAGILNTRGTIAMAKLGGDPDSATSQWFFNLNDNVNLDTQNGGFTVFGEVLGDGMTTIDQIAALNRVNANGVDANGVPNPGPFGELPVFDTNAPLDINNLVVFNSIVVVPEPSCLTLLFISGAFLASRRRRAYSVNRLR